MPDPLARRARTTPDRTAIVDVETGTTWGYDEFDASVGEAAASLAGLELENGDHLGLLAGTSLESVRLVHAAWRLGLRLVPLNARLSPEGVNRGVARSDLDALLCTPETVAAAGDVDCPLVVFGGEPGVDVDGNHHVLSEVHPSTPPAATWSQDDVALVPSTSGTTGEPKPVELTMGNLIASATASAFRLGVLPTDRWLLCLPVYHVGGLSPVLRCAHYGTTLVVLPEFDATAVLRAIRDHDVTGLSLVPTQLRRLLDANVEFPDSVRTVLLGGAPAPSELVDRCRRLDVPVHPTYGLTEAASQVATATPTQAFARKGTVGHPLQSVDVTIVGPEGEPLPAGERGEVVVSGPTVTPGYYGDPESTTDAFGPHGLHTGDLGHRDGDGLLRVHGRMDDVIVTGGENVHPREVEVVVREHPVVSDVSVVGVPDDEWGERVAALVVPTPGITPDAESLAEYCRERLAGFKLPRTVAFADELPRTASGTVDRSAVEERLAG